MKKEMNLFVNETTMLPGGGFYGGENQETLPGGGFHGGENQETLPGGGFHGGENQETLPGGGFHGGENQETLPGGGFHSIVCREATPGSTIYSMSNFSQDDAAKCTITPEVDRNTGQQIPEELIPKIYGCGANML